MSGGSEDIGIRPAGQILADHSVGVVAESPRNDCRRGRDVLVELDPQRDVGFSGCNSSRASIAP